MEAEKVGKNVENLIKKNKMKKEEVAQIIGITSKNFEKKLKGEEEFFAYEIVQIINLFNLSTAECAKIFFCEE